MSTWRRGTAANRAVSSGSKRPPASTVSSSTSPRSRGNVRRSKLAPSRPRDEREDAMNEQTKRPETWHAIKACLERKRERVHAEIRAYPTPIPRCDQQFNYL